jgi:hypothetical protein
MVAGWHTGGTETLTMFVLFRQTEPRSSYSGSGANVLLWIGNNDVLICNNRGDGSKPLLLQVQQAQDLMPMMLLNTYLGLVH